MARSSTSAWPDVAFQTLPPVPRPPAPASPLHDARKRNPHKGTPNTCEGLKGDGPGHGSPVDHAAAHTKPGRRLRAPPCRLAAHGYRRQAHDIASNTPPPPIRTRLARIQTPEIADAGIVPRSGRSSREVTGVVAHPRGVVGVCRRQRLAGSRYMPPEVSGEELVATTDGSTMVSHSYGVVPNG